MSLQEETVLAMFSREDGLVNNPQEWKKVGNKVLICSMTYAERANAKNQRSVGIYPNYLPYVLSDEETIVMASPKAVSK